VVQTKTLSSLGRERTLPRYHPGLAPSTFRPPDGARSFHQRRLCQLARSAAPLTLGLRNPLLRPAARSGVGSGANFRGFSPDGALSQRPHLPGGFPRLLFSVAAFGLSMAILAFQDCRPCMWKALCRKSFPLSRQRCRKSFVKHKGAKRAVDGAPRLLPKPRWCGYCAGIRMTCPT
jgi:hypothetical protein